MTRRVAALASPLLFSCVSVWATSEECEQEDSMAMLQVVSTQPGPTFANEGGECRTNLPPAYQIRCAEGLKCEYDTENNGYGSPGVCVKDGPTYVGKGEVCQGTVDPAFQTLCAEGLKCEVDTNAPGSPGVCVEDYCEPAADVPCPGSGNMCSGDQCCPRDALSGDLTFPCPSASPGFAGCENNTKVESCLEPLASLRQAAGKDPKINGLITPSSASGTVVATAKDPNRYGYLHFSPASVTGTATKARKGKKPYRYGYGHLGPADLTFSKSRIGKDDYKHGHNYWGPLGGSSTRTINNKCEYRYTYTYKGPNGKLHKRDYRRLKNKGRYCFGRRRT